MEALAALRDVPADLIITVHLPDMTGTELVYAMRADDDLAHKAFMLISSETNLRYLDLVRQAGTICILPKPFNGQQLRGALAIDAGISRSENTAAGYRTHRYRGYQKCAAGR